MDLLPHQQRALTGLKFLFGLLLLGLVIWIVALGCGCSKSSGSTAVKTSGAVVTSVQLNAEFGYVYAGDQTYAVVKSETLKGFYDDFRQQIFDQGVVNWDDRFDCNHFAGYYVALAQTRYYLANFQSRSAANTLALGTYWYHSAKGGHAIVAAMTERGVVFIEPQTGKEVNLTDAEKQSAYLKVF